MTAAKEEEEDKKEEEKGRTSVVLMDRIFSGLAISPRVSRSDEDLEKKRNRHRWKRLFS